MLSNAALEWRPSRACRYRTPAGFEHNPPRSVSHRLDDDIKLPKRAARVLIGYTMLGRPVDVVETSRGCTFDCSFCSIIEMRGRNFHTYSIDRVLADIRDARDRGARTIFIVDDNITLNVARFETLCRAIVEARLNDVDYIVQAMTSSIANSGESLAPLMREAGFRYVFLGIENILQDDLAFLRAGAKNARRDKGKAAGNATLEAIDVLHRHGMYVVGGLIVGNPDDTPEAIEANLTFARRFVDWPYIQHPTPYPGTPMTKDFVERNLIVNDRLEEYRRDDGRGAKPAPVGGRHRVHAVARRPLDESAAHAGGGASRSGLRGSECRPHAPPHVPWHDLAHVGRCRGHARGLRALSADSEAGARVPARDSQPLDVAQLRASTPPCEAQAAPEAGNGRLGAARGVSSKPSRGSADFERDVRRPFCTMAASDSRDGRVEICADGGAGSSATPRRPLNATQGPPDRDDLRNARAVHVVIVTVLGRPHLSARRARLAVERDDGGGQRRGQHTAYGQDQNP